MKKILIFLIGGLLSGSISAQTCGTIRVIGVVDGDTLRAEMIGMPKPLNKISIRIAGIDTPELKGLCDLEKEKAREVKNFLNKKFSTTSAVTLENLNWDKYGGRVLANVYFDGQDVSKMLINQGFATPYHGKKKDSHWCISPKTSLSPKQID